MCQLILSWTHPNTPHRDEWANWVPRWVDTDGLTGMEATENGKGLPFRELAIWFVKICETPVKFKMVHLKIRPSKSQIPFGSHHFQVPSPYIPIELVGRIEDHERTRKFWPCLILICLTEKNTDKRDTKKSLFLQGGWQKKTKSVLYNLVKSAAHQQI